MGVKVPFRRELLIILHVPSMTCGGELSFTLEPSDIIAVQEQPLMLHCQVEGIPPITTQWRRNGALIVEDQNYVMFANGSLLIGHFQKTKSDGSSDEGDYECIAQNFFGLVLSRKARVQAASKGRSLYECMSEGNLLSLEKFRWYCFFSSCLCIMHMKVHSSALLCLQRKPGNALSATCWQRVNLPPAEFVQPPQSIARPVGTNAIFTCLAQGEPVPQITWLKNGQILEPDGHVKLRNNNSTLTISGVTQDDEAIYQCIAENSAGSTQSSARLTVLWADGLPGVPTGVRAEVLSPTSIQVSWNEPTQNTQDIIGYVLHIRKTADPVEMEYQEAVSKMTLQQVIGDLEPSTRYSFYVKAYTSRGASKASETAVESTLGEVPAPPALFTKVINSTVVQATWEPSTKMGQQEGFNLYYRKVPVPIFTGPLTFPRNVTQYNITQLDASFVYEIKILAFNQHGEGNATLRFVSLKEAVEKSVLNTPCDCVKDEQNKSSTTGIIIGIHIGVTCVIFCVLFLMFSYRGSSSVSCPLNETQMSTLPLDDFSLMEECEVQFRQHPAEG
uniref:Immunoglobulin superfamily DCC subclass member 3 n=1 Tax=Sinocyclocheilus grahami TaxID=75366 RepID=A0A672MQQ8_SINGR